MVRLSFLVVVFILCVTISSATKVVDIDTICKNVTNYSFCSNLLNSKPGSKGDFPSLIQYTFDVLRVNATNTVNLINGLIAKSGSNFNATYHYNVCLIHFDIKKGALHIIEYAEDMYKRKYYKEMGDALEYINFNAWECLLGDTPSDPPFHDTSLLPAYANVVMLVAKIAKSILTYMLQA